MILVADTGPLNYLIQIGEIEVLPALAGQFIIPPAVQRELQAAGAPASVKIWPPNDRLPVRIPDR